MESKNLPQSNLINNVEIPNLNVEKLKNLIENNNQELFKSFLPFLTIDVLKQLYEENLLANINFSFDESYMICSKLNITSNITILDINDENLTYEIN